MHNHSVSCSKLCTCPTWTNHCSYLPPSLSPHFTKENFTSILYPLRVPICAFPSNSAFFDPSHSSAQCSPLLRSAWITSIQLIDNSIWHLSQAHLSIRRPDTINDTICFGNGSLTSGTPDYCTQNLCSAHSSRFCFYPLTELTHISIGLQHIPLTAWGYKQLSFYPFPDHITSTSPLSIPSPSCSAFSILIETVPHSSVYICVATDYYSQNCSSIQFVNSTSHSIAFPQHFLPDTKNVSILYYLKGLLIYSTNLICSSVELCIPPPATCVCHIHNTYELATL